MVAAIPPDDYLTDLAQRYYDGCVENGTKSLLDENSKRDEALRLLTEAIRIAPAHCTVLADCFQMRAELQMNAENYVVSQSLWTIKLFEIIISKSLAVSNSRFEGVQTYVWLNVPQLRVRLN